MQVIPHRMRWPHAPLHLLYENGAFMVTGATYQKSRFLNSPTRLTSFQENLFSLATKYNWQLQAWAILANHYHFIAISPTDAKSLKQFIQHLHSVSAQEINKQDGAQGRKVWFQYWDNRLTYEGSYIARLKYVNENPVRHGLVKNAADYPWCSANWFEKNAAPEFLENVLSARIEGVKVEDDF
jgi:putative transposase